MFFEVLDGFIIYSVGVDLVDDGYLGSDIVSTWKPREAAPVADIEVEVPETE